MNQSPNPNIKPKQLSPLTLAFLGDAVFGLMVREKLVCDVNRPAGGLHNESVKLVNARAQAEAMKKLLPELTGEETAIYKRGRNAHTGSTPKNADKSDYQSATGMEALFGYLYLNGEIDRLKEIFDKIII